MSNKFDLLEFYKGVTRNLKRIKSSRKNVTDFVKRMNELNARKVNNYLWVSKHSSQLAGTTYVKKIHGELK